jgi:peptidoglycan DL-endopeptidase RipA
MQTTAMAAALIVTVVLVVNPTAATSAPTPPPNPSNSQITAAQQAKNATAAQVGSLSAQVAQIQSKLDSLNAAAELAEQKVALTIEQLGNAQAAAAAALAAVNAASQQVAAAQSNFAQFVRASYMTGPMTGIAGSLLTATDPSTLLQRSDYLSYSADHQLDTIGKLSTATVAKSNADAKSRAAVQAQTAAANAAAAAKRDADAAVTAAKSQQAELNTELATTQNQLQAAQAKLADLNNQRAAYNAYVAEQARLARIAAAKAAAALKAAAAAAAANNQGNSNAVSTASGPAVPVAATNGGHWTAAAGQTAVNRAMRYLTWPYSFAAGNFNGPTYGVAVDFDSRNDGSVYGFDCSGLALYAWAPYIHMTHYAATQYGQAGNFHPSVGELMPGDLVFWSDNGTQSGIGHVAIYIGNGNVIQAPFSGAYIEITPLNQVENGYFGATRPLT